ncbi:TonB family protein [Catenovulum sediminis]|uniref:Protein TonB n=1 Tax=Catenovulum sediminis TaxID=1740262 RepID=A0ABV1RLY8_9ALTE|nr:TonB family protein [Catenovulum sediminis]
MKVGAFTIKDAETLFEQRNYEKARLAFESFAHHGNAKAQYYLGMMYYQGKGGIADIYKAYAWFSLAEKNGFRAAEEEIRRMRREIPSKRKAKSVAESLAAEYSANALSRRIYPQYNGSFGLKNKILLSEAEILPANQSGWVLLIGDVSERGNLINLRVKESFPNKQLEKRAFDYANSLKFEPLVVDNEVLVRDQVLVKVEFQTNNRDEHSIYLAQYSTYQRALISKAQNGNAEAQLLLAQLMSVGLLKYPSNALNAVPVYWYLQAAINGSAFAKFELYRHLKEGIGCLPEAKKADYWLQRSAEQGHLSAVFMQLRSRYQQNPSKNQLRRIVNTLESLVEQGHKNAHQLLALIYATSPYDDFYYPFKAGLMAKDGLYDDANHPDYYAILAASYLGQTSLDRAYEYFYQAIDYALKRDWPVINYVQLASQLEVSLDTTGLNLSEEAQKFSLPSTLARKNLKPISRPSPEYPVEAARRAVEGWVRLNFSVNEKGEVENITVVKSSPENVFEDNAIQAVQKWRYEPPKINASPTRVDNVSIKLDFKLQ